MTNDELTYKTPSESSDWEFTAQVFDKPTHDEPYGSRRVVRIIDLPVGSRVAYKKNATIGSKHVHASSVVGTVGKPEILGDGEVVCKYRDVIGEWDWVQPETTFFLVYVPQGKKLPAAARAWIKEDHARQHDAALQELLIPEWEKSLPALEDCVV